MRRVHNKERFENTILLTYVILLHIIIAKEGAIMIEERSIPLYIVLTIITCGIFGFVWLAMLTNDLNQIAGEQMPTSGGLTVLLVIITCGIYGLYWAYKCGEKIDRYKQSIGVPSSNSGILYLILYFLFQIITYALIQDEINKIVRRANGRY